MTRIKYVLLFLLVVSQLSCKKFITIPTPPNLLSGATVYTTDATVVSAMMGIYSNMIKTSGFTSGYQSIGSLAGLSADELINYSSNSFQTEFYKNSLDAGNSYSYGVWKQLYAVIYQVNAVITGLSGSTAVSDSVKQELEGEAEFLRSFCYFYLTNLFGDVPLITSTSYQVNDQSARSPQSKVYAQIVADLTDAQKKLQDAYPTTERIRPNRAAATALLSRVYLYTGDWQDAATQATAVINDPMYTLGSLDQAFLKDNEESIWQIQPMLPGYNTFDGSDYILSGRPTFFSLTGKLLNSFEPGDQRRTHWVDSIIVSGTTYYYPYKYKVKTSSTISEYYTVLRLSEQYLIRAEAEANGAGGGSAAAVADLNVIRNRAGLTPYSGPTDKTSLMNAILHERQIELFTEWGHRWLDLKRTNTADSVLAPIKGSNWQSSDQLYPIPTQDIANDPQLTQNTGY